MPLGCNNKRLEQYYVDFPEYTQDISFVGNLYDDKFFFFKQVKYIPQYAEGYFDATMAAQTNIYGYDIISPMLNEEICKEAFKYIDMDEYYNDCKKDILVQMIQKGLIVREQRNILTVLGEYYKVDHYAGAPGDGIPVNFKGIATYMQEMPKVFSQS